MAAQNLKDLIGEVVEEKIHEMFANPVEGLSLRPGVEKRLRASLKRPSKVRRTTPAQEVARRLSADW